MCGAAISPNAYACPQCGESRGGGAGSMGVGGAGGFWRDGKALVFTKDAHFPDRCVKSNVPTQRRLTRNLAWYPPWTFALIFAGLLIFIIVALCIQKKAKIRIGLSDEWFAKRTRATMMGWGSVLLGILIVVLGANYQGKGGETYFIVLLGIVVGLVGAVVGAMNARLVYPKKITNTHVWLNGVSPKFLGQLPTWPGGA